MISFFFRVMNLVASFRDKRRKRKIKANSLGKVAICVGHGRLGDRGAYSVGGVSEWRYNSKVAKILATKLKQRRICSTIIEAYPVQNYAGAMDWLAKEIDKHDVDIAIELHFNSFDSSSAEGYEYLYYEKSAEGKRLALCMHKAHKSISPTQIDRGPKAIGRQGRGGRFLYTVTPPAVITEPFFGSNLKEWLHLGQRPDVLAEIYAEGIAKYFES